MNEQLVNLISYLENPFMVVFWIEPTTKGDIYHCLGRIRRTDDEMKAFFNDKSGKYIDLYAVNFNDIVIYKKVDWLI